MPNSILDLGYSAAQVYKRAPSLPLWSFHSWTAARSHHVNIDLTVHKWNILLKWLPHMLLASEKNWKWQSRNSSPLLGLSKQSASSLPIETLLVVSDFIKIFSLIFLGTITHWGENINSALRHRLGFLKTG